MEFHNELSAGIKRERPMLGHVLGASVMTMCQMNDHKIVDAGKAALTAGKRAGAILLIAGLAACSTAPDWARPSLIYGDDAVAAAADASEDKDFPQLADVPDKPTGISSVEERRRVSDGLAADRERARYTDEVLRGGTETPAQAPRSAKPAPIPVIAATTVTPAPTTAVETTNTQNLAEIGVIPVPARGGHSLPGTELATQVEAPATRPAATTEVTVAPVTVPAPVAAAQAVVEPSPVPVAAEPVARARVASAPVQPARRAAVPALPESERRARVETNRTIIDDRVSAVNPASAAVQAPAPAPVATAVQPSTPAAVVATSTSRPQDRFERSTAPALTHEALEAAGSVVSARYGASSGAVTGTADPQDPVQVNMDALLGLPGPGASLQPSNRVVAPAIYANQGGPGNIPPYVVNFGHGSVHLTSADRQTITQAAKAVVDLGGVVRIVGHASSRTGDLDIGKHLLTNFRVSLDRATAVANALIQSGVDPSRVFVEAKGDAVPVYYESMPAGEAGNRRAEIFIE
ncbi:MAG: hypothetical protein COA62_02295 [Rhodobiaceae bacterium]|nr:MAG: hypothetical protein COA62_02295 [Rhodobiaceae bacterium]